MTKMSIGTAIRNVGILFTSEGNSIFSPEKTTQCIVAAVKI
jgi:hypothetical protein